MEKIRFGPMCEKVSLKPLVGGDDDVLYFSDSRIVSAGLVLSGFLVDLSGRAVLIGEEEIKYLKSLPSTEQINRLKNLSKAELIILLDDEFELIVKQTAQLTDTKAVLSLKPQSVSIDLSIYIEGKLNTVEIIHGVLMDVYGAGVMIMGESGVGKSETALDLITRGHLLVADDAVAVRREGNTLIGCAPSITRHLMEIRGIGIVDIRAMYGSGAIKLEQELDMVVNLEPYSEVKEYKSDKWTTINGVRIPLLDLPISEARNTSVLIEAAARNFRLKVMGHDAMDELKRRIEKSNKERPHENQGVNLKKR